MSFCTDQPQPPCKGLVDSSRRTVAGEDQTCVALQFLRCRSCKGCHMLAVCSTSRPCANLEGLSHAEPVGKLSLKPWPDCVEAYQPCDLSRITCTWLRRLPHSVRGASTRCHGPPEPGWSACREDHPIRSLPKPNIPVTGFAAYDSPVQT